ncbi:uncharacterized protein LOC125238748 isoform X2 [Leguminivora glycinivorella]|uniref:uncharacterized protein LOC125238748 isoform X2 n=1 Tax=Leguminivora glycinivorella TaxID=1035111 RepID=UPI00200E87F2|nr:uncharacterized protein LOC125238748 isoform X2 [Leguminivora glycinivorella]XP_048002131.1 uncharacterized protein LOC125238748 isoform X2 [Leguminivora glycinivorella]
MENTDTNRKISSFDHRDINYPNFHVLDKKHEKSISHDYLETHINSLKKLVNRNDASLLNYDWLGTTVLIRAGLEKLQNMTERKLKGKRLHPLDAKLLEFVIDLYETAKKTIALQTKEYQSRRRAKLNGDRRKKVSVLPKTKKGKKINTLQRMYVELNKARAVSRSRSDVEDFKEALDCLNMCLNDLHTAIKQISTITTYKEQRWFQNIKQLYLETDKEYLEVFLHLVMARLMSLIEERAKKMTEDDNLMRDKAAVDRIEVEVVLAMRICMKLEGIRALK